MTRARGTPQSYLSRWLRYSGLERRSLLVRQVCIVPPPVGLGGILMRTDCQACTLAPRAFALVSRVSSRAGGIRAWFQGFRLSRELARRASPVDGCVRPICWPGTVCWVAAGRPCNGADHGRGGVCAALLSGSVTQLGHTPSSPGGAAIMVNVCNKAGIVLAALMSALMPGGSR